MNDTGTSGVEHPLEAETVVEFDHPDGEIGESEGAIWDCWSTDEGWIYEVLDLNYEKVRINAERISEVHDDELRADGSGERADDVERSGHWIGALRGATVREPGPDADGPILQLHGEEGMVATEVDDEAFVDGLTHAAAELGMELEEVDRDE